MSSSPCRIFRNRRSRRSRRTWTPSIVQLHSLDYRNPAQIQKGGVLLVGGGNSGAEIAMELVKTHDVWLSGRDNGQVPFRIDGLLARLFMYKLILRFLFHRVLTVRTPMGRRARPKAITQGGPLIRVKAKDLERAGVVRVPKTVGVKDGLPLLEDGRVLNVTNVIWCTGFSAGFSWIHLPILGPVEPMHEGGIVPREPGLFFVGLAFLYSFSSVMIHGVGRDADRIAGVIAARPQDPSAAA